ncbi:hypothetical protein [Streptomyces sp. NBC_01800]|uniref:hypothetical protein n=1 Tax=Streptomyces sp. NBC_01800 TaxID=2975945 RepID=UPI003FA39225
MTAKHADKTVTRRKALAIGDFTGTIVLGIDPDAENDGAGGGTPPSGAPHGSPEPTASS